MPEDEEGVRMVSRFQTKCRMLLVGALAMATLAASPAFAGKGGGGGGGGATSTCWVTPNPVTNMSTYAVSGSGFPAGMVVELTITDKISTWIVYGWNVSGGTVAADGTFSIGKINSSIFYPSDLGTKTVTVTNANDKRQRTLCQCTFSVQ
ncbi:MAG TPA: hypothetical protein VE997_05715 [Candidatus Limnocylindria bacterium]|nr:hypothetical protein [Candidatus Limnocylindria bacterium]